MNVNLGSGMSKMVIEKKIQSTFRILWSENAMLFEYLCLWVLKTVNVVLPSSDTLPNTQ